MSNGHPRNVHQFDASMLTSDDDFRYVAQLIALHARPSDLIVVSSPSSLRLKCLLRAAAENDRPAVKRYLRELYQSQHALMVALLGHQAALPLGRQLGSELKQIASRLTSTLRPSTAEAVLAHGEIWTARLLTALLVSKDVPATAVDTRCCIRAERNTYPSVHFEASKPCVETAFSRSALDRLVVMGPLGTDQLGNTTILELNHFTSTIGSLVDASTITVWTSTAGIRTADPAHVSHAHPLQTLTFVEALELFRISHAKPSQRMLRSMRGTDRTVELRTASDPAVASTQIVDEVPRVGAKAITSLEEVRLIQIDLADSRNQTAFVAKLHKILADAGMEPVAKEIDIDRQQLMLAFPPGVAQYARNLLRSKGLHKSTLRDGYSLVAVVGAGLAHDWLLSYQFQQVFCEQAVEAIIKSDLSLVAIVKKTDTAPYVRALHAEMIDGKPRWLSCLGSEEKPACGTPRDPAHES